GSEPSRRFRARRIMRIIVPAIEKGTAIIRRIDQYIPRQTEVVPSLSASEVASLQSGQAAATAVSSRATESAMTTVRRSGLTASPYPNRTRSVKLVEHRVDHDARDRDVD